MEAEERINQEQELGDTARPENGSVQANDDSGASPGSSNHSPAGEDQSATGNGLKRKRSPPPDGMSQSAYKKLKRQQKWDAGKAERKVKRKEKERSKKDARRAAIAAGEEAPRASAKSAKEKSKQVPVTFVIDCGFDELMTENEIKSLASQITRCYSDNAKATYRTHLSVSSFNGRLRQRFDTVLEKQYTAWKGFKFYDEDFVAAAGMAMERMVDEKNGGMAAGALLDGLAEDKTDISPEKGEVIYLSSESENTIDRLDPYCTYIIGGLVDRNRHKGICYKTACDRGIKTAKLPIGEFMEMNSRYVLATNHVNEIMLHWLELGDWGEAFMKVIPKRKGGTLKPSGSKNISNEGDDIDHGTQGESCVSDKAEAEAEDVNAETAQS